jgi:biotin-(acetyl-CoA carboxylase) ligase
VGINFSVPGLVSYSYTEEEFTFEQEVSNPDGEGTITEKTKGIDKRSNLNLNLNLSRISVGVNVFL